MANGNKSNENKNNLCKRYLEISSLIEELVAEQNELKEILKGIGNFETKDFKFSTWEVTNRTIKIGDLEADPKVWKQVSHLVNSYTFNSMRVSPKKKDGE